MFILKLIEKGAVYWHIHCFYWFAHWFGMEWPYKKNRVLNRAPCLCVTAVVLHCYALRLMVLNLPASQVNDVCELDVHRLNLMLGQPRIGLAVAAFLVGVLVGVDVGDLGIGSRATVNVILRSAGSVLEGVHAQVILTLVLDNLVWYIPTPPRQAIGLEIGGLTFGLQTAVYGVLIVVVQLNLLVHYLRHVAKCLGQLLG